MFVREKKRKNKKYAYLVENVWTEKGTRQRVKKYLGKVISIKDEQPSQIRVDELLNKSAGEFVKAIIKDELIKKGFREKNSKLIKGEIEFDRETNEIRENNQRVVLKSNEGFLCRETVEELIKFIKKQKEKNYENRAKIMKELAKKFLEAGLPANENYFIILGDKIIKKKTMQTEREEDEQEFYY